MLFLQFAGAKVQKLFGLWVMYYDFICNFAANLTIYMKKFAGIALVVFGVLMLIVINLVHLTFLNILQLVPLIIIIIGVVVHVWLLKKESSY